MDTGLGAERRPIADAERWIAHEELRQVAVGAGAVLAFAAVLVLTYAGFGRSSDAGAHHHIYAVFNRVDGLAVGDSVQLSGVPVGRVDSMSLGQNYRARIGFRIDGDLRIPSDTSASIHTDGLFGRKFVVLEPGGQDTLLADGGVIEYTQDSMIVGDLLDLIIAEGRARRVPEKSDPADATQPY